MDIPRTEPALGVKTGSDGKTHKPSSIVIVDDDALMRELIHVVVARTSSSSTITDYPAAAPALRHILDSGADLLITDCNMEGMDGPALVTALRQAGHFLPIIMVSGSPDAQEKGEEAGIDRFIPKDAVNQLLPQAVRSLLAV